MPFRAGLGLRISLNDSAGPAMASLSLALAAVERANLLREAESDRVRLVLRLRRPVAAAEEVDADARCSVRSSRARQAGIAGDASICASEIRPLRLPVLLLPLDANATAMV